MKIAVLGATGHLSKCAAHIFGKDPANELFLFSRSEGFLPYEEFEDGSYDLIFNGVGVWDTPCAPKNEIFAVTERFDGLILDYQLRHPETKAVHLSSGAVYGGDFLTPVGEDSVSQVPVNAVRTGDFYTAAKLNSEIKHRAFPELSIVDLRLFGFFSRFMSAERPYFLSALVRAARDGTVFRAVPVEFWRDYIHMDDFSALLRGIASREHINRAVDVRSAEPVSSVRLIELFRDEHGVRTEVDKTVALSATGLKPMYYSVMENDIYSPSRTSLETVRDEVRFLF